MPKFLLGLAKKTPVSVKRNQVFFMCKFRIPEEAKESIPFVISSQVEADLLIGFYCDPLPGDLITHKSLQWKILSRNHYPTKRNSRDDKVITELILEFIGKYKAI